MHLVSAVGSSWEKEKKKKDICSAGCDYFLARSILVRVFLGAILHFAFLLFSLLACLSVPRGKTGERRRTHVPQALIISWPGASWNAFCIFAFLHFLHFFCIFAFLRYCKQRGCTCVAFGVFGQGSPIIINDINLPHILAICWRMNIMNEVWLAIEMKSS